MDIQRLRNLTTGRLHTKVGHVIEDLETITGARGLTTHLIPRVLNIIGPWLLQHVTDARFWDGEYDATHAGEYELPESTADERAAMLKLHQGLSESADDDREAKLKRSQRLYWNYDPYKNDPSL